MVAYVTIDTLHFALLVVVGAAGMLMHWDISRKLWNEPDLPHVLRRLSPLPPLTPVIALLGGRPFASVMWVAITALYFTVRFAR